MASSRNPYRGTSRKLVLAFDIGTTYSGISYSVLYPNQVPELKGVTRFPAQVAGGDSKIPSILYYDDQGAVRSIGAEAVQPSIIERAEDEGWIRVEWFKLHLRPDDMVSRGIPALPRIRHTSIVKIFADFFRYMYQCAQDYIQETPAVGPTLWNALQGHIEYIFTHPNGWGGAQQSQMRRAAVLANLIPDTHQGHDRVQFVTEGEASLHFCIQSGIGEETMTAREGMIIVDAGGGTIDLSAYVLNTSSGTASYEEIAPPECRIGGSFLVTDCARTYLEDKFRNTRFADDVPTMTDYFDQTTKLKFRDSHEASYIKFGSSRDTDLALHVRAGQLKLPGTVVASFFEPSIASVIEAISKQLQRPHRPITTVFLVGGFSASDWLFSRVGLHLQTLGIELVRPESLANKAVADGAVSFYLDHFVSVRVSKFSYGSRCNWAFDPRDPEHVKRSQLAFVNPSGALRVPNAYSEILPKGTQVSETKQFRSDFYTESHDPSVFETLSVDITVYRGVSADPQWTDVEPEMFTRLCTIDADTSHVPRQCVRHGSKSNPYYRRDYQIILFFGLTELKAQLSWLENDVEKRSLAQIVYDDGTDRIQSQDRTSSLPPPYIG